MPGILSVNQTETTSKLRIGYNTDELMMMIEEDARIAINSVSDSVFNLFLTEYVDRFAYTKHNVRYRASGEFHDSWKLRPARKSSSGISATIVYDPSRMQFDASIFKHGSSIKKDDGSEWGDARPYLADLLNTKGSTSSLGWNSREEAYWDAFVRDVFESGEIDRAFALIFQGV
jgi:hypothetical protein